MSPSSFPPCSAELYTGLVTIIEPIPTSPRKVQEIAILPSSSHPDIQYDPDSGPPAIGIPKTILLSCFLHARSVFFSHLETLGTNPIVAGELDTSSTEKHRTEISNATAVILLWEPNHLTAINWRKRALTADGDDAQKQAELNFLTSLLTSPLPHHAKSSNLWAYRLQILRRRCNVGSTWREELAVVMLAGERHAKNYHAWEYARQIWRLFFDRRDRDWTDEEINLFRDSISSVHRWCLRHPTDISGWAFLTFLLRAPPNDEMRLQEAEKVSGKTREFVESVAWEGASVRWFLETCPKIQV